MGEQPPLGLPYITSELMLSVGLTNSDQQITQINSIFIIITIIRAALTICQLLAVTLSRLLNLSEPQTPYL